MGQGESHPVYLLCFIKCFIKSSGNILEKLSFIKRQKKGILIKLTHAEKKIHLHVTFIPFQEVVFEYKKKKRKSVYILT